jgi:hypothetical protein
MMQILDKIIEYVHIGTVRFKKHALIRAIERNIKINEIEEVIDNSQIITKYEDDKPLKSYLLLGFTKAKRPLHVIIAIDEIEKYIWIISVYEPDRKKWDETFKKRLKK